MERMPELPRRAPSCVTCAGARGTARRALAGGDESDATVSSLFNVLENTRDLSRRNCRIMALCENKALRGDVLHHLDLALPSA